MPHHHTTPPGVTQGRAARLEALRAALVEARQWVALQPVCDAAIARIDALLTGHAPTVAGRCESLLPHLQALLADVPEEQVYLRRGIHNCVDAMETATGRQRTTMTRRERRRALVEG